MAYIEPSEAVLFGPGIKKPQLRGYGGVFKWGRRSFTTEVILVLRFEFDYQYNQNNALSF